MTTSRQKAIGSAAERAVAYALDGRRVGMDGGPIDVIVDGYMDVQVKAVKTLPSLSAVLGYLAAIPKRDRLRSVVVCTRPGMGRKAVRTITFDLDEFAAWHGFAGIEQMPYDGPLRVEGPIHGSGANGHEKHDDVWCECGVRLLAGVRLNP